MITMQKSIMDAGHPYILLIFVIRRDFLQNKKN